MMNYFREGGFNMWILLAGALASFIIAASRPREQRGKILLAGCIFSLISGMLGLSTGMVAVANNYHRFPDHVGAVAQGLSELSNNGSFAALLAMIQGVAALVTSREQKVE